MTKRKLLILGTAAVGAVFLGGGVLTQRAWAATTTSSTTTSLVQRIAEKFNLQQSDVQTVFDTYKTDRQAEFQQKITDRLNQAVTDGKITATQRDLLGAKQKEVEQKMTEIKAMTDETARRTAMDLLHTNLKAWATTNGIDMQWLGPVGGMHGKGGSGHRGSGMSRDMMLEAAPPVAAR